ncbi:hypothetical protein [Clostridium tyrobutyricum]|uniref:hypothetical protein n=1 Tax=Clostridium tyrobutyricum TaxID=1519 RepID=UPI0018A88F58|nr:hypothetical protein [Clostridium tyrobutyricum]
MSESDLNLDTIIRSSNIFWGDKNKRDKFNEFIKNKTDIKISNLTKGIIALDSSKLYINVKNISIHMNKLTENEIENNILKGLEKDDRGRYLYNIMNDIYLLFDKEELLSYISNTRKKIDVDIDMEYGCDADNAGIFVDQK